MVEMAAAAAEVGSGTDWIREILKELTTVEDYPDFIDWLQGEGSKILCRLSVF